MLVFAEEGTFLALHIAISLLYILCLFICSLSFSMYLDICTFPNLSFFLPASFLVYRFLPLFIIITLLLRIFSNISSLLCALSDRFYIVHKIVLLTLCPCLFMVLFALLHNYILNDGITSSLLMSQFAIAVPSVDPSPFLLRGGLHLIIRVSYA